MFDPDAAVALLRQEPQKLSRAEIDERLGLAEGMRSWTSGREARLLRALADFEKDPSEPAKDDAERLARKQNCGAGKAKRRTETATQLGQLPKTQDALENGAITDEHAEPSPTPAARPTPQLGPRWTHTKRSCWPKGPVRRPSSSGVGCSSSSSATPMMTGAASGNG